MLDLTSRYQRTDNFSFTQSDEKALKAFQKIQNEAIKQMPSTIYSSLMLTHLNQIKSSKLYKLLEKVPKGVLHHCHIDCCQDKDYYKKYIINDPIIYLTDDKKMFKIGTKQEAQLSKWISMSQLKKQFETEDQMVNFVSNITMCDQQDNRRIAIKEIGFWELFQRKIVDFFPIFYSLKHFKLYIKHVFQKFIKNGYDRLQWRALIAKLTEYDQQGNVIKIHEEKIYTQAIEQVYQELKSEHPDFTIDLIFFGLLGWSQQQNSEIFQKVCQINWDKTIGLDVVQEQGPSLEPYDQTINKVLSNYPHLNYKKVYHAGDTRSFANRNVQIAVKAGSVRIGHGSNIIQRLQFLPFCKNVCFQTCPVSGVISGARDDIRVGQGPILMSLGIPISISPDDPGKFGYQDSTVDFFMAMISYNWGLKDLKLIGIYSINHAICDQDEKIKLLKLFNSKWNDWIENMLLLQNSD